MIPFKDFVHMVADYITYEYDTIDMLNGLSDDEKSTIKNILVAHHEMLDSINNTASVIIMYIKANRRWMEENLNGDNHKN
jgi:hypothetical protein